jgi:pyruvate dehydrogenase (quinone)
MAKRTAADQFVEILLAAGVRRIYGVVGDSLNPVVDAVRHHDGIEWIHVRHEETGAFAAGAEAQLTGRLVACAGSCGPGNLHLVNGLYDAHRSMAPVLALAAQIPSTEIGTGYFQETQPTLTFQECSHYCELVTRPEQLPRVTQIAVQQALGRGGVGVVALPGDVADEEASDAHLEHTYRLDQRGAEGHAVLRPRRRRRPRRGPGPGRAAQGPGGPRAAGQGMDPVRQPL